MIIYRIERRLYNGEEQKRATIHNTEGIQQPLPSSFLSAKLNVTERSIRNYVKELYVSDVTIQNDIKKVVRLF